MKKLLKAFAEAVANKVDDDIIYGCDENAIRWHESLMVQELKKMKPKWIPRFLWNRILKNRKPRLIQGL